MSDRYVYIDAPTLDNSDQSKLFVNDDFKYVYAGNKESDARFPLYEKFTNSAWKSVLDRDDLSRNEFKPGIWGLSSNIDGDGDESPDVGGDYISGNTTAVHISNFITGKLDKLRFKFFVKNEINVANRKSDFKHSEITDYSVVSRVYILEPTIKDGKSINEYKVSAIANWSYGNEYTIDRDFSITPDKLKVLNHALVFVFVPNDSGIVIDEDASYTFDQLRAHSNADAKLVGLRSLPRGSMDNRSYITRNGGTNEGIDNGQNRILDFEYYINNDLVEEYIGAGSDNHRISKTDVEDLSYIKYSAPRIDNINFGRKSTAASKLFISHESLSRNNNFQIVGEEIHFIHIPYNSTHNYRDYNPNYGMSMLAYDFDNTSIGIWHTNRIFWLYQGTTEPAALTDNDEENRKNGWIKTNEIIAFSYFTGLKTYRISPEKPFIYNGNGLWLAANKPMGENGKFNFAVHYYSNSNQLNYQYNSKDKIFYVDDWDGEITINATPYIRVIFNHHLRSDWFDYIESLVLNHLT